MLKCLNIFKVFSVLHKIQFSIKCAWHFSVVQVPRVPGWWMVSNSRHWKVVRVNEKNSFLALKSSIFLSSQSTLDNIQHISMRNNKCFIEFSCRLWSKIYPFQYLNILAPYQTDFCVSACHIPKLKKTQPKLFFHLHSFCILQKPEDLVTSDCVLHGSSGFLTLTTPFLKPLTASKHAL